MRAPTQISKGRSIRTGLFFAVLLSALFIFSPGKGQVPALVDSVSSEERDSTENKIDSLPGNGILDSLQVEEAGTVPLLEGVDSISSIDSVEVLAEKGEKKVDSLRVEEAGDLSPDVPEKIDSLKEEKPPVKKNPPKATLPFSEEELQKYVSVYPQLTAANRRAQEQMIEVIENGGLDLKTFNRIQTARMQEKDVEFKAYQLTRFERIKTELDSLQPDRKSVV